MTMTAWWEDTFTDFDVESTGVSPWDDRIVSWCTALDRPGAAPIVNTELVFPGVPIPPGATAVHGITDEQAQRYGNPPRESLRRLVGLLADTVKARVPIVGMNLAYDFTMLRAECRRHHLMDVEAVAGMPLAPVLDVYVIDKYADPWRKGKRTLADSTVDGKPGLATHYGVVLTAEDAHDAVPDALAAGKVLRRIAQRHPEIARMGLYRLHAMQADWRYEQCADLEEYFRRKGKPSYVDRCWPYCLDEAHGRAAA